MERLRKRLPWWQAAAVASSHPIAGCRGGWQGIGAPWKHSSRHWALIWRPNWIWIWQRVIGFVVDRIAGLNACC
jgi:hypothetical protein